MSRKIQVAYIVAIVACSLLAVPFFYSHRMNIGVFIGGILTFLGAPLLAGTSQKQTHRSITLIVAILLLLCPAVYAATDSLAVQFEKFRDSFFLATGSTIVFATTIWLANSLKLHKMAQIVAAAVALLSSSVAVIILLWAVIYLE